MFDIKTTMQQPCPKKELKYRQLTLKDREEIALLAAQGSSNKEISQAIGFHISTIYRESKRNRDDEAKYYPSQAHAAANARKSNASKGARILCHHFWAAVVFLLKRGMSPNCISGTLKHQPDYILALLPEKLAKYFKPANVSHETIYSYIYRYWPELYKYLARKRKARRCRLQYAKAKSTKIPDRVGIEQRGADANQRMEFGHFEVDTIVSRKSKEALAVIVDRCYRFVFIRKLPFKGKEPLKNSVIGALKAFLYIPNSLKTLTYDNGTENAAHMDVNRVLGTKSFFARPYRSCDKGSIEQINGLIRRFLPKKTNFALIEQQQLDEIAQQLNERPRKCLGYKSPLQSVLEHFGFALQP